MAGISQFTPQQVLEAGRRAEVDGKRDYAVQFYQHVMMHHRSSAEATEADAALRRLDHDSQSPFDRGGVTHAAAMSGASPQAQWRTGVSNQHGPHDAAPNASNQAVRVVSVLDEPGNEPSSMGRRAESRKDRSNFSRKHSKTARRRRPVGRGDGHGRAQKLKTYRLGRFLAALLGAVGLIFAIAGLVALGANLMLWVTKTPNVALSLLATSPMVAGGQLTLACVLILLAQMAKATFEAAAHGREATSPAMDVDAD